MHATTTTPQPASDYTAQSDCAQAPITPRNILPPLTDLESRALTHVITHQLTTEDQAADLGLSVNAYIQLIARPTIRAYVAVADEMSAVAESLKRASDHNTHDQAKRALADLAANKANDPNLRLRAALAILTRPHRRPHRPLTQTPRAFPEPHPQASRASDYRDDTREVQPNAPTPTPHDAFLAEPGSASDHGDDTRAAQSLAPAPFARDPLLAEPQTPQTSHANDHGTSAPPETSTNPTAPESHHDIADSQPIGPAAGVVSPSRRTPARDLRAAAGATRARETEARSPPMQ